MAESVTKPGILLFRALIVLTALALIYRLVVVPVRCAHAILPIEHRTKLALSSTSASEATRLATANLAQLEAVCGACETDVDVFLLRAFNLGILGRQEEALVELANGLRIDNRPELYLRRGQILLEMGRLDAAIAEFAIVARFGPILIEKLDPELRARIAAKITASPSGERP